MGWGLKTAFFLVSISLFDLHAQPQLSLLDAEKLARLPLSCLEREFPYKTGVVLTDSSWAAAPKAYHPVFYGCFDWHSAAHGYWSLARLLKLFPQLSQKAAIESLFDRAFTPENISRELLVFEQKQNRSFERPYGWAWLLQLHNELFTWQNPKAQFWRQSLDPLVKRIKELTVDFLGKLVYPIRSGEHANLAFALKLIYDNAQATGETHLVELITKKALELYGKDKGCPLDWEPSGYDFLSPCLEEADLMRRVLAKDEFDKWMAKFLPTKSLSSLQVARVLDRTDGKLVHLDGLNLSRANCLWAISDKHKDGAIYKSLGDAHFQAAWDKLFSGDYAGEHWLASFAIYAITRCGR